MDKRRQTSELTVGDLFDSKFGSCVKVVYNSNIIIEDNDDGLYLDHKLLKYGLRTPEGKEIFDKFMNKYKDKRIYNFYCRVVEFHHTELYIEGEQI